MADFPISPGRMVKNVSDTLLPWTMAGDLQNVDIDQPGDAKRRNGFIRALAVDVGQVGLVKKFEDYDGTEVYIIVGSDGIYRET